MSMRFPAVFLVGAPKCGTTSLVAALDKDPRFYFPDIKEPHYFSSDELVGASRYLAPVVSSVENYRKLYSGAVDSQVRWDASTSYLWSQAAPGRIADVTRGAAKIVVVLREPVERSFSHYLNDVREGIESRSFSQAIQEESHRLQIGSMPGSLYLAQSLYVDGLRRYFEIFGRERVHVMFLRSLLKHTPDELVQLYGFLDISLPDGLPGELPRENPYGAPRSALAARILGSGPLRGLARPLLTASARRRIRGSLVQVGAERPCMSEEDQRFLSEYFASSRTSLFELLGVAPEW